MEATDQGGHGGIGGRQRGRGEGQRIEALVAETGFGEMGRLQSGAGDGVSPEERADPGEREVPCVEITPRMDAKEIELPTSRVDALDAHHDAVDGRVESLGFKPQPQQVHELHELKGWRGGVDRIMRGPSAFDRELKVQRLEREPDAG